MPFTAFKPSVSFEYALDRTVHLAVRAHKSYMADTYLTVGGIPKPVTRAEKVRRLERLEAYIELLDSAFHWWGEWGGTQAGIKMEIARRAAV